LSHTDKRGKSSSFAYEADGRLKADTSPIPAQVTLARATAATEGTSTFTTAEGRATTYKNDTTATGDYKRTSTFPSGLSATATERANATSHVTLPTGEIIDTSDAPDPRFGMLTPLSTRTTTTPLG